MNAKAAPSAEGTARETHLAGDGREPTEKRAEPQAFDPRHVLAAASAGRLVPASRCPKGCTCHLCLRCAALRRIAEG